MKRKIISLVLALSLCFAMYTGGTMAYLTGQTAEKVNTFTYDINDDGKGNVKIELAEPHWKDDTTYQFAGEGSPTDITAADFGSVKAANLIPGMKMKKDPIIKMLSETKSYVGVSVTPTMDWEKFDKLFSYTLNTGWVALKTPTTGTQPRVYVYNPMLTTKNEKTTAVFSEVIVKADTTITRQFILDNMPASGKFDLKIMGYGTQAIVESDAGWVNATYALKASFPGVFA